MEVFYRVDVLETYCEMNFKSYEEILEYLIKISKSDSIHHLNQYEFKDYLQRVVKAKLYDQEYRVGEEKIEISRLSQEYIEEDLGKFERLVDKVFFLEDVELKLAELDDELRIEALILPNASNVEKTYKTNYAFVKQFHKVSKFIQRRKEFYQNRIKNLEATRSIDSDSSKTEKENLKKEITDLKNENKRLNQENEALKKRSVNSDSYTIEWNSSKEALAFFVNTLSGEGMNVIKGNHFEWAQQVFTKNGVIYKNSGGKKLSSSYMEAEKRLKSKIGKNQVKEIKDILDSFKGINDALRHGDN